MKPFFMKNILLIFIRNPELGKVKTRLARTLGDVAALRIYHILLEKTRAAALGATAERHLYYTEAVAEQDDWSLELFQKRLQSPGDLGARMEAAFQNAFVEGADKVLIVGSDCPELSGEILNAAFEQLDTVDFVVGPVPDGGYYLLGMRAMEASVFRDIAWSTETVRARTLEKIAALGKSFALLPELVDIDEAADWAGYLERFEDNKNSTKKIYVNKTPILPTF